LQLTNQIKELWGHLSYRRHKQYIMLFILMFFASIAEVVSLGAVLPFLSVITAPEQIFQHQYMQPIIKIMGISHHEQLIAPVTVIFIMATILASVIRLLLLYVMNRVAFATGTDLNVSIYKRTLYQDYLVHISKNSSDVINGIVTKTAIVINGILRPVLRLISSSIILLSIIAVLILIDSTVAFISIGGFSFIYWIVIRGTKNRLKENSNCISQQSTFVVKALQEGLGGIRDVLIDGSQEFYSRIYRNSEIPLRRAYASNAFVGESPRYIIEAIGMTLIALLAYMMTTREGGIAGAIPVLGALALGAQRLLPTLQQAYSAYSTIKGSSSSFADVLSLLEQPLPDYVGETEVEVMPFNQGIELKNIGFRYSNETPMILHNVNLKFSKGMRIGLMGVTGCGKSTLLDIVMGLLLPTDGELTVDGKSITKENIRSWQAHISHVPQNIYLSDSTIEENIAFGLPETEIDHSQVREAAKHAQIDTVIEKLPEQYNTSVGERGVRLSGGQRQRIGIARALYKSANVIIFDEATSALDNNTEKTVMQAVESLGKDITIFIIAHRLSTLKNCDQIIELEGGRVKNIGKYKDVI
jgi:ATP-binding cassette, subfamily B, bacterial PglK